MPRPLNLLFQWLESRISIDSGYSLKHEPVRKDTVSFLQFHLAELKGWLVLIFATSLAFSLFEALMFLAIGWGIDALSRSRELGSEVSDLAYVGIACVVIIRPTLFFLSHISVDQIMVPNLSARVRWRSHLHTMKQPILFFLSQPAGGIANRVLQSGDAVRGATIEVFDNISYVLVFCLITFGYLVTLHVAFIMVFAIWFTCFTCLICFFVRQARAAAQKNAAARSVLSGRIVDVYTNAATVKLFARTTDENNQLKLDLKAWAAKHQSLSRITTSSTSLLEILNSALIAGFAALSLFLWKLGAITEGQIAATLGLVLRIVGMSGWIMFLFKGVFDAIGVVRDSMDSIPDQSTNEGSDQIFAYKQGRICFRDVSFSYNSEFPLFRNLRLEIEPGQKVGIVGQSGAGKSTILDLILGMHVATKGDVLIDGQTVSSLDKASLWKSITLVSSQVPLLNRSVKENITLARPTACHAEIMEAAKRARADGFISGLVDSEGRTGFDAFIGGAGREISGGQRQRLMLARAFLKDSPILLLDEATSALDPRLELDVVNDIITWLAEKQKTALVVSHRLSTLTALDRILVIEKGAIIEDGSHQELLFQGGIYAELWHAQNTSW